MLSKSILIALVGLAGVSMTSLPAFAAGCEIDGIRFTCKDAKGSAAVLEAFADEETSKTLAQHNIDLDAFKRPADVEIFRRSIEKNWRQVRSAERRERRRMLRRQISASEFEEWSETYDKAAVNYAEAINLYRVLVWHGKLGKPAPVDTD